jgi:uncharacterized membrane protein
MKAFNVNMGNTERLLSVLGGAVLLVDLVRKQKVSPVQSTAASYLLLRGLTGFCFAYHTLGKTRTDYKPQNINIRTVLTVNQPRHQVYAFWRRLENLPLFMKHLKAVEVLDETTSQWTALLPGGMGTLSWKAQIVRDDPGALLSWHSLPGSSLENAGKVTFTDAQGSGTEIHAVISYHAPLGILGEKAGRLINPGFETMVRDDIRNFKRHIERGEIAMTEDQSSGGKNSLL